MANASESIFVTVTEAQPIHVTMTETEVIRVAITTSGATGPQGPIGQQGPAGAGGLDPNSHIHADPLAIPRVMEYVAPFKAYVVTEP
jgi:hypothetical protein